MSSGERTPGSGLEIWYVSWDLELLASKGFGDLEGFGSYMLLAQIPRDSRDLGFEVLGFERI